MFGKVRRGLNLTFVKALKESGLGPKQAMFVRHLAKHGSASQAELSSATFTDPGAVNRALDSLEKKGWVFREDHPTDRRRWVVKLTKDGKEVAKTVDKLYQRIADSTFQVLSEADRKIFFSMLDRVSLLGFSDEVKKELI